MRHLTGVRSVGLSSTAPFSDDNNGAALVNNVWTCTNEACAFTTRIRRGEVFFTHAVGLPTAPLPEPAPDPSPSLGPLSSLRHDASATPQRNCAPSTVATNADPSLSKAIALNW